ncbi:MAG: hypothetical protein K0S32_2421 [Bacteroidetes bacterium]|jgi:hypothetical protein|nr:hypothetical protein [Bacteroidota bacterium]
MKSYFLKFIFCLSIAVLPSYSQNSGVQGLNDVKRIYSQMYADIPLLNKTTYVNYEITTKLRQQNGNAEGSVSTVDIKYYSNKTSVWFLSKDLCMYRDQKNTFTIIPKRKVVYWAQSTSANNVENRIIQMKNIHDSVFKNCKDVSSEKITENGKAIHLVKVTLDKKWATLFQVKQITFYLNDQRTTLLKQVIEYTNNKKVESVEYLFKEVHYNYTKQNIDVPVKKKFLEGETRLRAPYNDYKLIDVRNKTKH